MADLKEKAFKSELPAVCTVFEAWQTLQTDLEEAYVPDEWTYPNVTEEMIEVLKRLVPELKFGHGIIAYDGSTQTVSLKHANNTMLICHEVGHYLACPEERKKLDNYGLGPPDIRSPDTPCVVDNTVSGEQEALASLIGICLEAHLGQDVKFTLCHHSWDPTPPEKFTAMLLLVEGLLQHRILSSALCCSTPSANCPNDHQAANQSDDQQPN